MKKRVLAILMILVLATAGLFAAYNVTVPGDATAQLTAVIGEFLHHGFATSNTVNMDTVFASTVEVNDAFNETTDPSFFYGYKTNAEIGSFDFEMTVGDFTNGSTGTVLIKEVQSTKPIIAHSANTNVYTVFRYTASGAADKFDATKITIKPFLTHTSGLIDINGSPVAAVNTAKGGAPNGNYVANISFHVSAT